MKDLPPKKPIFNVHSHVFTHEHVPPFLAKSITFFPIYYLIHVPTFVRLYIWYNAFTSLKYRPFIKTWSYRLDVLKKKILQNSFTKFAYNMILLWLGIVAFYILFDVFIGASVSGVETSWLESNIRELQLFLRKYYIINAPFYGWSVGLKVVVAAVILLFVKSIRKSVFFVLNQVRSYLHLLPGEKTKALMERYLLMARFAIYGKQSGIYSRLKRQYPEGTHFIVLPMDMKYMEAGKVNVDYYEQMKALAILNKKEQVHAFVFIDPRRIREERTVFLDYSVTAGKVTLKESIVKHYIEEEGFEGFKIYPALGYFPFDDDLLALWKYAADNRIPIMSHGVKGVIYYRGKLKKEWNYHPVFKEYLGNIGRKPMLLNQFKNDEFQVNFTHPMNFLCLLEEPLLRLLIAKSSEENKLLFGYTNENTPLKYDLSQLKVCYAHYGGAEEWHKFLEKDRDNYAQQLMAKPKQGIDFGALSSDGIPWGRYENVWKYSDWYSVVSSMMIQYPNFYADISYIVSEPELYPVLKHTISTADHFENHFTKSLTYESRNKLRKRVLFGSDFYVVRSQKADKDIYIELTSYLSKEEFDLIARENPNEYLYG